MYHSYYYTKITFWSEDKNEPEGVAYVLLIFCQIWGCVAYKTVAYKNKRVYKNLKTT